MVARERDDTNWRGWSPLCADWRCACSPGTREQLTQLAQTSAHQGVVAWSTAEFSGHRNLYAPATAGAAALLLRWMR